MSAANIAKVLGGFRAGGGWVVHCPVPSHGRGYGDRRPSLSVRDGASTLLVYCFSGCTAVDILAELRRLNLTDSASRDWQPAETAPKREPGHDRRALAIWTSAQPIANTDAERYLRSRGITVPLPSALRYAADMSALVAAVQRPDGEVIAVQRTFLDGARKADIPVPRLTIGRLGSGAVRLAAAGEALGICEGIEDGLSAQQLTGMPVWVSLGATRLNRISLPACAREIHIFGDNDAPGELAARSAGDRHSRQGRKVFLRFPPEEFDDWNGLLTAERNAA